MTGHPRTEELLGPYVLGELGPEETQEFERHLEGCPSCREEVALLRLAHRGMAVVSVAPPPGLNAPSAARGYPSVSITLEESSGDPRPSPNKVLGGNLREA